jgi:putative transposase
MKRKRFKDEQIVRILKEQEAGVSVSELRRKHGVSDAASINGKPSMAALRCQKSNGRRRWRTRTAS